MVHYHALLLLEGIEEPDPWSPRAFALRYALQNKSNREVHALNVLLAGIVGADNIEAENARQLYLDTIYPWQKEARAEREKTALNAVRDVWDMFANMRGGTIT